MQISIFICDEIHLSSASFHRIFVAGFQEFHKPTTNSYFKMYLYTNLLDIKLMN
jgi:hypothetical protein